MADFNLVDPKGWEYDLQSIYSAYIGYFQLHNIAWYERSWGHLFSSFEAFLAFSWPVITVTDAWTGKAHIVTRGSSLNAFLKMVKTRFGETLHPPPNILQITPFETATRHLRTVSDYAMYKKLHSTLPAAVLVAFKTRVRAGEPKAVEEVWSKRDKTFLSMAFEWSERNEKSCLEWGYAAVRCGHLDAQGLWPPVPDTNYRKGHYIVAEYVDKVVNKYRPTYPWQYAFGESQVVDKAKLPEIIQAIISSLASPDSETIPNNVVLVVHGMHGDLDRLQDMDIKIPHNMLIIDTSVYERFLFSTGKRGVLLDAKTNKPRAPNTTLSLESLVFSLPTPSSPPAFSPMTPRPSICQFHNSGNDAFMCLFALQMLLDPEHTTYPTVKQGRIGKPIGWGVPLPPSVPLLTPGALPMNGRMGDTGEFGQMGRPTSALLAPGFGTGPGGRRSSRAYSSGAGDLSPAPSSLLAPGRRNSRTYSSGGGGGIGDLNSSMRSLKMR